MMRLEHWTNATEQATYVGERLVAAESASDVVEPFAPVPFVWSDQYDVKIQSVGHFDAGDDVEVAHGTLDDRQFVALFGRNQRIVGALGFSRARHVMQYRRLIAQRASWDEALELARS
jgi:NADPH-dependent 2,4-dienoyl-CoA reductase/sulfur reductase-like enzyme